MKFGGDVVLVVIKGNSIMFGNTAYGAMMSTIEGIKLDKKGVIKEFPDLENREDWRVEAINRFKFKVKELKSEEKIAQYIIDDFRNWGYKPMYKQIQGQRKVAIK